MNKFGELIKLKREQMSLLQRHLASKIDIDVAMLSKIERGDRIAKKRYSRFICRNIKY